MASNILVALVLLVGVAQTSLAMFPDGAPKGARARFRNAEKYIVYMGARNKDMVAHMLVESHRTMLSHVLGSRREAINAMAFTYKHSFAGFSAWLTEDKAKELSRMRGVVKIFKNQMLQVQTSHSWDYLGLPAPSVSRLPSLRGGSQDVIVGVLDTGIWPESNSFSDKGMSDVPSRWKGVCDNKGVTNKTVIIRCNKKVIGIRSYLTADEGAAFPNARDGAGHGTHTTSTIAGNEVPGANMFGLGNGTTRGGLPSARIAMYKVCGHFGCSTDAILAAFDDAIHDGVDILSLSLGGPPTTFEVDPIAIGSFYALEKGILVSCAAGNAGPDTFTISNSAPWILTVGASGIDRKFAVDIRLGNYKTLKGVGMNLNPKVTAGLVTGRDEPSLCLITGLSPEKVKGKILVCNMQNFIEDRDTILYTLVNMSAAGVIIGNDFFADLLAYTPLPAAIVKVSVLEEILAYARSTKAARASLSPTDTELNISPAPTVAGFSSRGPNLPALDILKPDIVAPGVNILASWSPIGRIFFTDYQKEKSLTADFAIISGTSMACPHATGAAAYIKSVHPDWSPAAIKSALITTAKFIDDTKQTFKDFDGTDATPFAFGGGEINPSKALFPGLVYDTTPKEYIAYLCASGYTRNQLKIITGQVGVTCPSDGGEPSLNYPSISVPSFKGNRSVKILRTVTNVGAPQSIYRATATLPIGVGVSISPGILEFSSTGEKLQYSIEFTQISNSMASRDWKFGSITWISGSISVRSPFALNILGNVFE